MIDFQGLENVTCDKSIQAGKHSQTERELRRGGSIMRVDQHEFWSNFAAEIGQVGVLEFDDVLLESLVLILADFAVLDLTRSVARLAESIYDLLGADESVAVATGRCGVSSRDGVRVYKFSFECLDDDVHFNISVGGWLFWGEQRLEFFSLSTTFVVCLAKCCSFSIGAVGFAVSVPVALGVSQEECGFG